MRLFKGIIHRIYFILTKMGVSIPKKNFDWRGLWTERGEKAQIDANHFETIDGRSNGDEINAIEAVNQQIAQLSLLPKGSKWLDVGVGSGLMHSSLKMRNPEPSLSIGCDFSLPSLRYCKNTNSLTVINCSADQLPFRTECFDFILFYSVSHCLSGHKKFITVLTEFSRVLKPGGAILVGDVPAYEILRYKHFSSRWFFPSIKKVRRDIRRLGLDVAVVDQPACAPYRDQRTDWVLTKVGKLDAGEVV